MMSNRLRMGISIIAIFSLFVTTVGAAYIFRTGGTILIDHGSLYVDGLTLDQYIIGLVGVGGGRFDQSLNTTDVVTFENVTVTDSITLGGVTRSTWTTSEASYTISTDAGIYYAENGTTGEIKQSTSLSGLWNTINAETSGLVAEFTVGTFIVDGPLVIQSSDTVIRGQGPQATILQLANNVNNDIIQMTTYYHNVVIKDICLDGNRDNQNAGKGIDFNCDTTTYGGGSQYWGWFSFENIMVVDCDEAGVYVRSGSGLHNSGAIHNFRIFDNDGGASGHQLELVRLFDTFVGGPKASVTSMRLNACTRGTFEGVYFGGGMDNVVAIEGGAADTCGGHLFSGCKFDNGAGSVLQLTGYACRNLFVGCQFTNFNQNAANNTYPCVSLESANALYNKFIGCTFTHDTVKTEDRWTYAYQETQDGYTQIISCVSGYGAVLGGNAEHFTTNEADLVAGSHTIISECYKDDGNTWGID